MPIWWPAKSGSPSDNCPPRSAEGLRRVRVFGRGELARDFVEDISPRLESMGLKIELMDRASAAEFDKPLPPEIALSPALALAANRLRGIVPGPEFLPPKVHPWQQLLTHQVLVQKTGLGRRGRGRRGGLRGRRVPVPAMADLRLQSKWKAMERK